MFNSEIEKALVAKYGMEEYKIFCKLEAEKNNLLVEDYKQRGMDSWSYDCRFEADWYNKRFNELND